MTDDSGVFSIAVELEAREPAALEPTQGYRAYALLLQLIERRDPEVARSIHDRPGPKPLTVSPLLGQIERRERRIHLRPGEPCWLRLTILDADLFVRVLDALARLGAEDALALDSATLRLRRVVTVPGQSPWAAVSSFDRILAEARPDPRIRLRFLSPTAFRGEGNRNLVLPLPDLVFGSLAARWNQFAPRPLSIDVRTLAGEALMVARYQIETRMLDFGRYHEIGLEGEVEYEVATGTPAETSALLNALADFAFFGGVGAKTTMGMGQARRIGTARATSSPGG